MAHMPRPLTAQVTAQPTDAGIAGARVLLPGYVTQEDADVLTRVLHRSCAPQATSKWYCSTR